jgi:hypothetical protein
MFPWDKPDGGANLTKGARVNSAQWVQGNMHQRRKREAEIESKLEEITKQSEWSMGMLCGPKYSVE